LFFFTFVELVLYILNSSYFYKLTFSHRHTEQVVMPWQPASPQQQRLQEVKIKSLLTCFIFYTGLTFVIAEAQNLPENKELNKNDKACRADKRWYNQNSIDTYAKSSP